MPTKNKQPDFNTSLLFYWDAFWELSTTRSELGPIPWTAINDFCKRYKIESNEEYDEFLYFIRQLDNAYREMKSNERNSEQTMKNTKSRFKRR